MHEALKRAKIAQRNSAPLFVSFQRFQKVDESATAPSQCHCREAVSISHPISPLYPASIGNSHHELRIIAIPMPTHKSRKGQQKDEALSVASSIHFDGFTSSSDEDDNSVDPRSTPSGTGQRKKRKVYHKHATKTRSKQAAPAATATSTIEQGRKRRATLSPLEHAAKLQGIQLYLKKSKTSHPPNKTKDFLVSGSKKLPKLQHQQGSATTRDAKLSFDEFDATPPPPIKRMTEMPYGSRSCLCLTGMLSQTIAPEVQAASSTEEMENDYRPVGLFQTSNRQTKSFRTYRMHHYHFVIFLAIVFCSLCNDYNSTVPYPRKDYTFNIHGGWKKNATGMPHASIFLSRDETIESFQPKEDNQLPVCHWLFSMFC